MTDFRIGVLDGDGIGPEVVAASTTVLEAAATAVGGVTFDFIRLPMGFAALERYGEPMPTSTLEALRTCDGWIMGPHDAVAYPPPHNERRNPSSIVRKHFDLYANIRPAVTYPGIPSLAGHMDLVVVRENTEGFYSDRNMVAGAGEFMPAPGVVLSVGVFTRRASERIARTAFNLAQQRRKHVTIVHKANVIPLANGLFRETCMEIAADFPDVQVDDYHIDAMAAHLVRRPADFDVIVATNMFGDILSDLTGELAGSLGLSPALNAGDDLAMAQAAHGSAPDIAGRGIANPVGELLSTAMLMAWLADRHHAPQLSAISRLVNSAVTEVLEAGLGTLDVGGTSSTVDFTGHVLSRLQNT